MPACDDAGAVTLLPHVGQNLKFGGITELHLPHVVPIAVPAFVAAGCGAEPLVGAPLGALDGAPLGAVDAAGLGGWTLPRFGRGSSATGWPQRAHCGTPIGVNALHASQTKPTSISLEFYPLAKWCVKERGL